MSKTYLSGKRVLVVEDDTHLREVICQLLESFGAQVTAAENGLVAKDHLDQFKGDFAIVLSDVRMPQMDGVQLLLYAKKKYPNTKFMIFTGFSEILEAQEASRIGADGFLAKPFRLAELSKALETILDPAAENLESESQEDVFCPIRVEEFMSSTKLLSDIYIRITAKKFLKVAKADSEIEISRIQTYKQKKVDYFYVRAQDFHKYANMSVKLAKAVTQSSRYSPTQKFQLLKHTSEVLVQEVFVNGLNSSMCDEAQAMVENTLKMVGENDDLFELLVQQQSRGDKLYSHSLGISVYACMIAKKMGWTSLPTQYKVMMAGLFHDIGFKELPRDLHEKPRFKMSSEEVEMYESHPARGRELLMSMPGFPHEIATIVSQHHESMNGAGYPSHSLGIRIHPIARVLRAADEFVEALALKPHASIEDAKSIAQELFKTKLDELDKEALAGVYNLLDLELPSTLRKRAS